MRILIYNWKDLAHPAAGGAEVFTDRVAREWLRSGHQVTLFCSAVSGKPAEETIAGLRVVRRGSRLGVYREARRYWGSEGSGRFDLVIDEVNTRPFLAPTYVTDTPVAALIHQVCREIWWYEAAFPVAVLGRFWLEKRWLQQYRSVPVVTVSESSRKSLVGYGLSCIEVVPEGIDDHVRPNLEKSAVPTVLFVGRLVSNKRPDHALRAFAILRQRVPDAKMWVVGEGSLRRRLERSAPDGVDFFGRVSDSEKRSLMAQAHVQVVTSVREGWGLVVDEAAAMGTVSVGYDVPGLRDSLSAAGGVIVRAEPTAAADALMQVLGRAGAPGPTSWGARPWPEVAQEVLAAATSSSRLGIPVPPG